MTRDATLDLSLWFQRSKSVVAILKFEPLLTILLKLSSRVHFMEAFISSLLGACTFSQYSSVLPAPSIWCLDSGDRESAAVMLMFTDDDEEIAMFSPGTANPPCPPAMISKLTKFSFWGSWGPRHLRIFRPSMRALI